MMLQSHYYHHNIIHYIIQNNTVKKIHIRNKNSPT